MTSLRVSDSFRNEFIIRAAITDRHGVSKHFDTIRTECDLRVIGDSDINAAMELAKNQVGEWVKLEPHKQRFARS